MSALLIIVVVVFFSALVPGSCSLGLRSRRLKGMKEMKRIIYNKNEVLKSPSFFFFFFFFFVLSIS